MSRIDSVIPKSRIRRVLPTAKVTMVVGAVRDSARSLRLMLSADSLSRRLIVHTFVSSAPLFAVASIRNGPCSCTIRCYVSGSGLSKLLLNHETSPTSLFFDLNNISPDTHSLTPDLEVDCPSADALFPVEVHDQTVNLSNRRPPPSWPSIMIIRPRASVQPMR